MIKEAALGGLPFSQLRFPISAVMGIVIPGMLGKFANSEEKHEPVSDINTAGMDSLKVFDPDRPIREANIQQSCAYSPGFVNPIDKVPEPRGASKIRGSHHELRNAIKPLTRLIS
jgi:hypothetical protein